MDLPFGLQMFPSDKNLTKDQLASVFSMLIEFNRNVPFTLLLFLNPVDFKVILDVTAQLQYGNKGPLLFVVFWLTK